MIFQVTLCRKFETVKSEVFTAETQSEMTRNGRRNAQHSFSALLRLRGEAFGLYL